MERVNILAPSRLHFGLLNETGMLGRVDGGIGVSLVDPHWELEVTRGEHFLRGVTLCSEHAAAVQSALDVLSFLIPPAQVGITVNSTVPCHAGLGSKTSLLLAIGKAVSTLANTPISETDLCRLLRRGGTSGVGLYSFKGGKFVWDAGHRYPEFKNTFGPSSSCLAPPPPAILSIPVDWLQVVHFRFANGGLHGEDEANLFKQSCPIAEAETLTLISCVVSEIVPALMERDELLLQRGVKRLQTLGFKKIEWDIQDPVTQRFRQYWEHSDATEALGLSSLGPTLFTFTTRSSAVRSLIDKFETAALHVSVTNVNNRGALIKGIV